MYLKLKHASLLLASFLFLGCGGGDSPSNSSGNEVNTEMNSTDINNTEMNSTEMNSTDINNTEMNSTDINNTEMNSSEMNSTEMNNTEMNSSEMNSSEMNIIEMSSTEVNITSSPQVVKLGMAKNINAKVSLGTSAKSLYLVFSNGDTNSSSLSITHNAELVHESQSKIAIASEPVHEPLISCASEDLSNMHSYLNMNTQVQAEVTESEKDLLEDRASFKLDLNGTDTTAATARKIVSDVNTTFGTKTLNVWVSDDSFDSNGSGCIKAKCVTQRMIDALAESFLKPGVDNDIYDWVTNVYGEEWGPNDYNTSIEARDEITILLTDINEDNNTERGIVGFFQSKDNFLSSTENSGSNERIMFYIDSVLFANGNDSNWSISDPWPRAVISTLAHEFQHMIHLYQKTLLLTPGAGFQARATDIWINEMLSESTEDLIASKIEHTGPRGVDYTDGSAGDANNTNGRYPEFNTNNALSLTFWSGELADYSKVNAFGAYLLRNYGATKVLHDIMYNPYVDERAILDAVNKAINVLEGRDDSSKTFVTLLNDWGTAVLLSDIESPNVDYATYNTGGFTPDDYNASRYQLGSINFFNYEEQPSIQTSEGTIQAQGNYYYKIGDNLRGDINIDLNLSGQTEVRLIAK